MCFEYFSNVFQKISEIKSSKNNLMSAINGKGGNLSSDSLLSVYDDEIYNLPEYIGIIYKCASTNAANKTWSGYEGCFDGEKWIFDKQPTENLSYSFIEPEIDCLYDRNAEIQYNSINGNQKYNDVLCYYDMSEKPENITFLNITGSSKEAKFGFVTDELCMKGGGTYGPSCYQIDEIFDSNSFTVAFWKKYNSTNTHDNGYITGCTFDGDQKYKISCCVDIFGGAGMRLSTSVGYLSTIEYAENYPSETQPIFDRSYWNHYAFVYNNITGYATTYINGIPGKSSYCKEDFNRVDVSKLNNSKAVFGVEGEYTCMCDLVVSRTAMTDEQIKWLAWKSREVTRKQPEIVTPNDLIYTITINEYWSEYLNVSLNFGNGEIPIALTVLNEENKPDWLNLPSHIVPYEECVMYGTPNTSGEWIFQVKTHIEEEHLKESFKETWYENCLVEEKIFDVKIIVGGGVIISVNDIDNTSKIWISENKIFSDGNVEVEVCGFDKIMATQEGTELPVTITSIYDMEIFLQDIYSTDTNPYEIFQLKNNSEIIINKEGVTRSYNSAIITFSFNAPSLITETMRTRWFPTIIPAPIPPNDPNKKILYSNVIGVYPNTAGEGDCEYSGEHYHNTITNIRTVYKDGSYVDQGELTLFDKNGRPTRDLSVTQNNLQGYWTFSYHYNFGNPNIILLERVGDYYE